jgi:hypothetical protein
MIIITFYQISIYTFESPIIVIESKAGFTESSNLF